MGPFSFFVEGELCSPGLSKENCVLLLMQS